MSPSGSSERISFLRATIARLETGQASGPAATAAGRLCEVVPARHGDAAAACGFALTLAVRAAGELGTILWIAEDFALTEMGQPYAPGLAEQGLDPNRLVLVRAPSARQALWALEEALKSPACAAVVGEVHDAVRHCDLTATRRLVVAARASGAEGILLHGAPAPGDLSTAAQMRFEVRSQPSPLRPSAGERRPILEVPAWDVRVLKARAVEGRGGFPDPDRLQRFIAGAPVAAPSQTAIPLVRRRMIR
jgi:protein ImuA